MSAYLRKMAVLAAALTLAGCGIPEHMEVRAGLDPDNVDEDVRFRTTYYFRVFDVCEDGSGYKKLKLQTDSLYRFRMTGKANSLFTQVHFEAGTLKAYEIDPFGSNVVYDSDSNRFRFETQADADRKNFAKEVKSLARLYRELRRGETQDSQEEKLVDSGIRAAVRDRITALITDGAGYEARAVNPRARQALARTLEEFVVAASAYKKIDAKLRAVADNPDDRPSELKTATKHINSAFTTLRKAKEALIDLGRNPSSNVDTTTAVAELLDSVERAAKSKDAAAKKFTATTPAAELAKKKASEAISAAFDKIAQAAKSTVAANTLLNVSTPTVDACPTGTQPRKGFQILGPEGWRTFDQDERLILAMSASGKPLINTLKDLSDRVLNERKSLEVVLLELVSERLRTTEAEHALGNFDQAKGTPQQAQESLKAAIEAFEKDTDGGS